MEVEVRLNDIDWRIDETFRLIELTFLTRGSCMSRTYETLGVDGPCLGRESLVNSRPIRVTTLIEGPDATGGVGILLNSATYMACTETGVDPVHFTIVTYQRAGSGSPIAEAALRAHLAVRVIRERRRWDTRALAQVREFVAESQPDIVESRNVKSHFFVRLLGIHERYPWLAWHRGYIRVDLLARVYNGLDRWSLRGAHRLVVSCEQFREQLIGKGINPTRIRVLYNFVDPPVPPSGELVERARRDLGLGSEPVVVAVGRLSKEKGHADLLRAAATLSRSQRARKFRVLFVGDGPERTSLTRLAQRLGIGRRVTFLGSQRDVAVYYRLATLLALPSLSEGFPNVMLEAMAGAVPIVATSVGGVPEAIEDQVSGLLVPPGHPEAMARAMLRLLDDSNLRSRITVAARSKVHEKYGIERYGMCLSEIYRDALGRSSG